MHGRREDVVRRLTHVDVVVRVHALTGEIRDHLVGVHVRARAGAGLEDVDRELVVELAGGDAVAGGGDALGHLGVEQPEIGIRACGGGLDPAEPVRDRGRNRLTRDGEIGDRLVGLASPQLLRAHGPSVASRRRPGRQLEIPVRRCRQRRRARARSRARRCRS